jgi:hypothetical protein
VLRVEVIVGLIASGLAILTFMARAYANIRRGRRIKRTSRDIDLTTDAELRRMQEEIAAAEEMSRRKRERDGGDAE